MSQNKNPPPPKDDQTALKIAVVSTVGAILIALIGIIPPLLNARSTPPAIVAAQPTVTASATNTSIPTAQPTTLVPTTIPSATIDFVAAAQTFDVQAATAVKATSLAQTQFFIIGQAATATHLTRTPMPILPTKTPIVTAAAAPYPTASTNKAWTPIVKTFDDGVEMVLIPKGCFMMGSTNFSDTQPVTNVCFDQPFWIDKYDVTQGQFKRLGGTAAHSPKFSGDNRPVDSITWAEARSFCEQKRGIRLPTEAEWEYAARGPDAWIYPWGNEFDGAKAVYFENSDKQTANVGSRPLAASWVEALDMAGNVWQWTSTIYDQSQFPYPYKKDDERDNISGNMPRVLRGGSWNFVSSFLRAANRYGMRPDFVDSNIGFRCARSS